MKKLVFTLALILVVATGCGKQEATALATSNEVCGQGSGCTLTKQAYVGTNVGDQIPNLTLYDSQDNPVSLYDMVAGKDKFILSLAADWCSDCHRQNEKLNNYYKTLDSKNEGAAVVFINYSSADGSKTTNEDQMKAFIDEQGYSFPAYYDKDGEVIKALGGVNAVPFNYVLDENAIIKAKTSEIDMDILFLDNEEKSRI